MENAIVKLIDGLATNSPTVAAIAAIFVVGLFLFIKFKNLTILSDDSNFDRMHKELVALRSENRALREELEEMREKLSSMYEKSVGLR